MSKSYINKVYRGTKGQQNEENTLRWLKKNSHIPECSAIEVNSKILEPAALQSIPSSSERQLIKLKSNQYYYGFVKGSQATDKNAYFLFHDGTYYQGEVREGSFDGSGKLTQASFDFNEIIFEYQGEWKRGKPDGKGRQVITNSIVYQGSFKNGKKNGLGRMTYKDETVYEGEFKDNAIEGAGKYTTKAHEWQGTWKEGYLQGSGKQTSYGQKEEVGQDDQEEESVATQSVYVGGFKRGQKDGMGTYTWGNDFSEYTGHFSNGQLDGEGRIKIGQTEYIGEWKKGVEVRLNAATASKIQFKKVTKKSNEF